MKQPLKRANTNQGSSDTSDGEEAQKFSKPVAQIQCMIGQDYTLEEMKDIHPQQNTFTFGDITITSAFDSGNMARCEEADAPFSVSLCHFTLIFSITSGWLLIHCPTSRTVVIGK